jgi:hypothetical protein
MAGLRVWTGLALIAFNSSCHTIAMMRRRLRRSSKRHGRTWDLFSRMLLAATACAACSGARPPSAPPPAKIETPSAALAIPPAPHDKAPATPPASEAFERASQRVLDGLFADDPGTARELGLHEYDGRIAPMSREAIAARIARLRGAETELAAFDDHALTPDEALDRAELRSWVATSLFWLVDMDGPRKVPSTYEALFAVAPYVDRDYAPLEERARRLVAQEEAALIEVPHARENLSPPLSKPVAEVAARNFTGFASYLRGDVARLLGALGDETQRARFAKANGALASAAADLGAWLKMEAARGDQSHVLGPARFAKLLRVQEGLETPLADFARMNEADLEANRKAYDDLAAKVTPVPVREADLFAAATRMMQGARDFAKDHGIVTFASDDAVTVRETPPYARWNFASIEMSGPFETARSAFYQITYPDRAWPPKEREAYLGTMGDLLGTTIHEVYPGHFVQGRWAERAPTRVQKAFGSYSFVEGWAHYVERMMIDEGFGSDDPANRLAMLRGALLRNCRFAAAVGIHTQGMTVEQAARRFETDCRQDTATAREQAARGTFDPGYFAYTLGKLQILALRERAAAALGKDFSLRRFHDALLSHGSPPVALVADAVLRQIGAR